VPVRNALLDSLLDRLLDRNFTFDVLDEVECEAVAGFAGEAEEGEEGGGDVFALFKGKRGGERQKQRGRVGRNPSVQGRKR
jgi:hypothetical protein